MRRSDIRKELELELLLLCGRKEPVEVIQAGGILCLSKWEEIPGETLEQAGVITSHLAWEYLRTPARTSGCGGREGCPGYLARHAATKTRTKISGRRWVDGWIGSLP